MNVSKEVRFTLMGLGLVLGGIYFVTSDAIYLFVGLIFYIIGFVADASRGFE